MTSAIAAARRAVDAVRISEREKRRLAKENAALRKRVAELEAALAARLKES